MMGANEEQNNFFKDMARINHSAYADVFMYFKLMSLLTLLMPATYFLPDVFLKFFFDINLFNSLFYRNSIDYIYIVNHGADFAKIYVGGYVLQFYIAIFLIFTILYICIISKTNVFILDRYYYYILMILLISSIIIVFIILLGFTSDFGYFVSGKSWFENNPSESKKFLPQPMERSALIVTGMLFSGLVLFFGGCVQLLVSVLFGRRVKFDAYFEGEDCGPKN